MIQRFGDQEIFAIKVGDGSRCAYLDCDLVLAFAHLGADDGPRPQPTRLRSPQQDGTKLTPAHATSRTALPTWLRSIGGAE
jgi:hypothetical protein